MADVIYTSQDGDTVDLVCYRHYGNTVGKVEAVLAANPGLAAMGPVLQKGIEFTLPGLTEPEEKVTINEGTVKLWS